MAAMQTATNIGVPSFSSW